MIIFRPPTQRDLASVALNMREADVLECKLMGQHTPLDALTEGVELSAWSFAAIVEDEPVCIFGVASDGLLADEGCPWLLSVNGIEKHAKAMLIGTRAYLSRMRQEYETLSNYVLADNRSAIRYLKWCGFDVGGQVIEVRGGLFLPFSMDCRKALRQAA